MKQVTIEEFRKIAKEKDIVLRKAGKEDRNGYFDKDGEEYIITKEICQK